MSKIIVITTKDCQPCKRLKSSKITDINGNEIKPEILDIEESDEAVDIVLKTGVMEAPSAFLKNGDEIKKCNIFLGEDNEVVIHCEGEGGEPS